jgi:chromate reductase
MGTIKILAFAGSTRTDSYNKKLVRIAVEGARAAGAEVTLIDFRDFPMPLYDGDLEAAAGLPEHAKRFKQLMIAHHGLLISTPEYNMSVPGVLKNAIDWASREESDDEPPLVCFRGKTAALVSASPGSFGASRSLAHVKAILDHLGAYMMPEQVSISKAHEAFDEKGTLKDAARQKSVMEIGSKLVAFTQKMIS